MTALTWIRIRKQGEVTPSCEMPGCKSSKSGFGRLAKEHMFLMGHPIGWYCALHASEIRGVYASARGSFEPEELAA